MMQMKHVYMTALLMLCSMTTAFAGTTHKLVVELKSGATQQYELADKPVVTFVNRQTVVKSAQAEASYAIDEVARYFFVEGDQTAIEAVDADASSHFTFSYVDGRTVRITGARWAEVYSLEGKRFVRSEATEGAITVSLDALPQGIYVVRTDVRSVKCKK